MDNETLVLNLINILEYAIERLEKLVPDEDEEEWEDDLDDLYGEDDLDGEDIEDWEKKEDVKKILPVKKEKAKAKEKPMDQNKLINEICLEFVRKNITKLFRVYYVKNSKNWKYSEPIPTEKLDAFKNINNLEVLGNYISLETCAKKIAEYEKDGWYLICGDILHIIITMKNKEFEIH